MVGFQLYLPPVCKLVLAANDARGKSDNIGQSIAEGGDPARTFKLSQYYDANVFVDVNPRRPRGGELPGHPAEVRRL